MLEQNSQTELRKVENGETPLMSEADQASLENALDEMNLGFGGEMVMGFIKPAIPKIIKFAKDKMLPQAREKAKEFLGDDKKRIEIFQINGKINAVVYDPTHHFEVSNKEKDYYVDAEGSLVEALDSNHDSIAGKILKSSITEKVGTFRVYKFSELNKVESKSEKKIVFKKEGIIHSWSIEQLIDNLITGDLVENIKKLTA